MPDPEDQFENPDYEIEKSHRVRFGIKNFTTREILNYK